jgi:predicted NBD/HSP70 family sugar kinase
VVGVDFDPYRVTVAIADVMGQIKARTDVDIADADPAAAVVNAIRETISLAGAGAGRVRRVVLGTPGIVDPATGEITLARDIEDSLADRHGVTDILQTGAARWRQNILDSTRDELRVPTMFENDVNLASVAEAHLGAARDGADFVLMWLGRGVGLSIVLGGRVHRGGSGAAGEIGYLPVAGASIPDASVRQATGPVTGYLQGLVGANAVSALAREHGLTQPHARDAVRAAVDRSLDDDPFLDGVADRVARGVASICVILDPPTVVLTGEVGRAGGHALAERVQRKVLEMAPVSTRVVPTAVPADPVLHGALLSGLQVVRAELFDWPATS